MTPSELRRPVVPVDVETPRLCLELPAMQANIRRMAAALRERGVAFRPHAKTHKSLNVARALLEAGAVGLTTATIGEAEVFAAGGVADLFIAYPIWVTESKADRLRSIAAQSTLAFGVDSVAGAEQAGRMLRGVPVSVRVEVDSGELRTGVAGPEAAVAVADAAVAAGLLVEGVFTHGGHSYGGRDAGRPAAEDEVRVLNGAADAMRAAGHDVRVLSAGSTPTAVSSARAPVTEERPGTFVFGDRQQVALGAHPADSVAVFVAATVVSTAVPGQVVLDAGAKMLSKDSPLTVEGFGALPEYPAAVIRRVFDHHALVDLAGEVGPAVGQVVAVVPNHVCPVVNLSDSIEILDGNGGRIGCWPIDARGRNA